MKKMLAIIIILILAPGFIQANKGVGQEEVMKSIVEDLNLDYIKGDLSANERLNDIFMELDVLEGIGYNIKENLAMDEIDRLTQEEKNYSQINLYGYDKDNNQMTIILSSYFNEEEEYGETYLYINYLNKEKFLNINGIIKDIVEIFKDYNVSPEIATNIEGIIDEKIDINEYKHKIEETVEGLNGKILDTYKNDNLISYNIYTPEIDNYMTIGKEKMNLNIAIRSNKTEDTSVIYIGTPIIVGGY